MQTRAIHYNSTLFRKFFGDISCNLKVMYRTKLSYVQNKVQSEKI
jgi:hypothetical protein